MTNIYDTSNPLNGKVPHVFSVGDVLTFRGADRAIRTIRITGFYDCTRSDRQGYRTDNGLWSFRPRFEENDRLLLKYTPIKTPEFSDESYDEAFV